MLSADEVTALQAGPATPLGTVSVGQTAGYSSFVIPPHTLVRIESSDGGVVRLCREHIYGAEIGRNKQAPFSDFFTTDNDAAEAADGDTNAWEKTGFVNEPVLIRAGVAADGELKVYQDEQDGELIFHCSNGARNGQFIRAKIGPSVAMTFTVTHDDDDNTELLQYQLIEYRRAASDQTKYWDGAAWTTTETWIDITGSATLVTFTDAVTSDEGWEIITSSSGAFVSGGSTYELRVRSKADYAAGFSRITNIGLYEDITSSLFDARIGTADPVYLYSPYWSRVGGITDNNTKLLYVSRMG